MYLELLEKAAAQNNPKAISLKGREHKNKGNVEQALVHYCTAAELGWQVAARKLPELFYDGYGVEKDLVQAVSWGARTSCTRFWQTLPDVRKAWNEKTLGILGCDFHRLAMEIGKGLYWYQYQGFFWSAVDSRMQDFGVSCLDYYCGAMESQQEAIVLFLWFWNEATGVKGPGQMIGQMVWEERYECLVKEFGVEESEEERGVKRLLK